MAYELKEGQGTLFVNSRKETEKHPDRTGAVLIDGKKRRIAGWIRTSKKGQQYMSLQVSDFQEQSGDGSSQGDGQGGADFDDEIPF